MRARDWWRGTLKTCSWRWLWGDLFCKTLNLEPCVYVRAWEKSRVRCVLSSLWGMLCRTWRVLRISQIAWAIYSPEETCNCCFIGGKISISSSHTRTGWRWRWWTSCVSRPDRRFWWRSASGATYIKKGTSGRKAWICCRTQSSLHKYEEKDLQSGKTRLPHWNKTCQETPVGGQK